MHELSSSPPVVVVLPEELDMTTTEQLRQQLSSAFTPDAVIVIADMTSTEFCDTTCFRILLSAHEIARARGVELRLVLSSGAVWRVLSTLGFDSLFALYPSVHAAQAPGVGAQAHAVSVTPRQASGNGWPTLGGVATVS